MKILRHVMPTPGLVRVKGKRNALPVLVRFAIVHPDGNQTILFRALLDADFRPSGPKSAFSKAAGAYTMLRSRPKKARPG